MRPKIVLLLIALTLVAVISFRQPQSEDNGRQTGSVKKIIFVQSKF